MKLNWFSQRSLHLVLVLHLLPFLCHDVAANTEIINFSSSRARSVDLPWDVVGNWSTLRPSDNERRTTLEPAALHTPLRRVCERDRSRDGADTVASRPPFSCPHELWLFLDLDDAKWASYSTFTLRLSWPASIPADFEITTYTPEQLLAKFIEADPRLVSSGLDSHASTTAAMATTPRTPTTAMTTTTTRARYARIRAVDAGVPAPGPGSRSPRGVSFPPPSAAFRPQSHALSDPDSEIGPHQPQQATMTQDPWPLGAEKETMAEAVLQEETANGPIIPFIVILEPTYMGVLPATLLPTVGFLVPVLLAAALFVVPWVTVYFESFARQARLDGLNAGMMTRTGKDRKDKER